MTDDWIAVSAHAADRWHERTDDPGIGPRGAWIEGQELSAIPHVHARRQRYHHETGMLLLAREGVLMTVIDVATARQEIRDGVRRQVGELPD